MWDIFLKVLQLLPVPLVTLIVANIIPYLSYRQNADKNKVALMDTVARELGREQPCAYLVESCVARLHNIRPLSWAFLRVVLPCNHSLEIIRLVSSGRRVLDLFEVSVASGRPVVQYAAALSDSSRRRNTMFACFLLSVCFLALLTYTEWQLLNLLFESGLRDNVSAAVYGEVMYKLLQMLLWAAAVFVFTFQGVILKRADKRLSQVRMLIASNFPAPTLDNEQESENTGATGL
ncbi:hypothetical protein [Pectobacterium polaris]|uniref:hypothetical protein n=1 Tax=Pectobacterium polaris TaxID=2042057 RepID=UPI001F07C335|nr:hypothetical protein [Pectobacterium polaris]